MAIDNKKVIIENAVRDILTAIEENANLREGLVDTPERVARAYLGEIFSGYSKDPRDILKAQFTEDADQMVVLTDIELYSTCEHHTLPFWGKCHIAYLPEKKVVGISKLARVVECYARRLQIQERLCNQIADAINDILKPKGVGVIIEAQHFCMTSRGVKKQHSIMKTSALRGCFYKDSVKDEFFKLVWG